MPEIGGDFVSINVACLDDAPDAKLVSLPVRYFNGRDNEWMQALAETPHL